MSVVDPATLQAYLHEHIPVSRHMGARVLEAGAACVRLRAPLAPNLNHRQTAFGGSLSALAILSAWSLLWVRLRDRTEGHRIVIHENSISYLAPAVADFEAVCDAPDPARWDQFVRSFETRGRARIELHVRVDAGGERVAEFRGRYVAFRTSAG